MFIDDDFLIVKFRACFTLIIIGFTAVSLRLRMTSELINNCGKSDVAALDDLPDGDAVASYPVYTFI